MRRSTTATLLLILAFSLDCSTVERDNKGPVKTEEGEKWCYRFPGASAAEFDTGELSEYPEEPGYCYCTANPDDIGQMWAELAQANALAACIWTAKAHGLDPTQTNCGEVMEGPVHGDLGGDTTCKLYAAADFSLIGEGETGG